MLVFAVALLGWLGVVGEAQKSLGTVGSSDLTALVETGTFLNMQELRSSLVSVILHNSSMLRSLPILT
jgi:hypothetical protein